MPADTDAEAFVELLAWQTTADQLDEASRLEVGVDEHHDDLLKRISNLEAVDVASKQTSLQLAVNSLTFLEKYLQEVRESLSDANVAGLATARLEALAARAAADEAGSRQFSSEPITGAGSAHWRLLWQAAERFSEKEAYRGYPFPVVEHGGEPGRCVLCHQELSEDAVERFKAFAQFVSADVERLASEAEEHFGNLAAIPGRMTVFDTTTQLALQRIESENAIAHRELWSKLEGLG